MENRILYDLMATQPSIDSKRHGGGKYAEVIFKRMLARGFKMTCVYDSRRWLNPEIEKLIKLHNVPLQDLKEKSLQQIVDESRVKILYTALPNRLFYGLHDITVIGTIHGLRRLETPADNYCFLYKNNNWKDWMFYIMNSCFSHFWRKQLCRYYLKEWNCPNFRMVTVSNHTAHSIKVYFPQYKDSVIPVFYSPSTNQKSIATRKYNDRYFLLVSGNRLEKNNLRAIKALDYLFSNGFIPTYKVKVTGAKNSSIYRYKVKNKDKFDFLGYVDDSELEQLYHDAFALIYPSLNEGFGYPPLEAMHYGVPVLSSSYTSIPEVCGDANLYFNPFSVEEIANRILQICNKETYTKMTALAKKRYEQILIKQNNDMDRLIDYIYSFS